MRARLLLRSCVLGVLLFAASRVGGFWLAAEGQGHIAELSEDELLLHHARRAGWHEHDPVVVQHLVQTMRFVHQDPDATASELLDRALELELHEHDPVVRSRLLYRARRALQTPLVEPSEEQIREHWETHPERFARGGRVAFRHRFLSRMRYPDVMRKATSFDPKARRGDPLAGLGTRYTGTIERLRAEFGPALARGAERAPLNRWHGPLESPFGAHFLWVEEREGAVVPSLVAIRDEVRADFLREQRAALRRERIARLRAETAP